MTTPHQNDRVLVTIPLPAGPLGVNISSPAPQFESNNHVWVLGVNANSPMAGGKLVPGDWIVCINECNVQGQGVGFCQGILAATAQSTTRKMVVLRSTNPLSFIQQKENTTVHTKATNNQAIPTVTPHENLKRPPPLSQASAAHAPLMITTTTTATPMKKYPPLQPIASSKIAGVQPAPLSSAVVMKQTKPQVKAKIYQKTAPLPPKSKAKTQQKTAPLPPKVKAKPQQKTAPLPREVVLPDESDWPEPGFVCHQQKWYCTQNKTTTRSPTLPPCSAWSGRRSPTRLKISNATER